MQSISYPSLILPPTAFLEWVDDIPPLRLTLSLDSPSSMVGGSSVLLPVRIPSDVLINSSPRSPPAVFGFCHLASASDMACAASQRYYLLAIGIWRPIACFVAPIFDTMREIEFAFLSYAQ